MPDKHDACCCGHDCCNPTPASEVERLMLAFIDCDRGAAEFGKQEAQQLRDALRRDQAALQQFFDYLVQDMILGEIHER